MGEDLPPSPDPQVWPPVCILIPARNEAEVLPLTLPALLKQDYPGPLQVLLIDDRSADDTAGVARRLAEESGCAERLTVLQGAALPDGWVGKVWALEQGRLTIEKHSSGDLASPSGSGVKPHYFLLTDADIRHAPNSLRRLVTESESGSLGLNSRMARLRCESGAERLLIPPFIFFFNLLYPMRRVNNPRDPLAAAAGGCVLVSRSALERAGGFNCIKSETIDDVNLARQIKRLGLPIRLALSRGEVQSLRAYETLNSIWAMVRRTAFTELRYSWLRLSGALAGIALLFLLPPLLVLGGGILLLTSLFGAWDGPSLWALVLMTKGLFTWILLAALYGPAVSFFGLKKSWSLTLPLAAILFGAMTADSALRHFRGLQSGWRNK